MCAQKYTLEEIAELYEEYTAELVPSFEEFKDDNFRPKICPETGYTYYVDIGDE
jgi:hypothetical protein